MGFYVLSLVRDDNGDDDMQVVTKKLPTQERAEDIAKDLTESFRSIEIVRVVKHVKD